MFKLMKPLSLLLTLGLASCASQPHSTPIPPVITATNPVAPQTVYVQPDYAWLCALTPIQLSHKDTDGTKSQVIPLNAATDKVCKR